MLEPGWSLPITRVHLFISGFRLTQSPYNREAYSLLGVKDLAGVSRRLRLICSDLRFGSQPVYLGQYGEISKVGSMRLLSLRSYGCPPQAAISWLLPPLIYFGSRKRRYGAARSWTSP